MAVDGKAFLGTGWSFPVALDSTGVRLASFEEDVRQSLLILLRTNRGERLMRPTFGAGLDAFVFEPVNTATLHALSRRIEETLIEFEPRIDQIAVIAAPDPDVAGRLLIDISYRIRATNSTGNLVYPFYLREAQP